MYILILVATRKEIQPLIEFLRTKEKDVLNYSDYSDTINFIYKDNNFEILVTGVGMVNTAYEFGQTREYRHEVFINVGICGSFKKKLKIGTVVNVVEDCYADLGAEDKENFLTLEELGLADTITIKNIYPIKKNKIINELPKVKGITVNTVHGNKKSIAKVVKKFNPDVESMEGAAFMDICIKEYEVNIQIRAVSNYVEERNRNSWDIPLAIKNLNKTLIDIIDNIKEQKYNYA